MGGFGESLVRCSSAAMCYKSSADEDFRNTHKAGAEY